MQHTRLVGEQNIKAELSGGQMHVGLTTFADRILKVGVWLVFKDLDG